MWSTVYVVNGCFFIASPPTNKQTTMKFIAVLAVICAAASVEAAPERKRTLAERKSENKAGQRVLADETYDPLLGMDDRRLAEEAEGSMSMGNSAAKAGFGAAALAAGAAMLL